jgi:general secretion pathway protein E
MKDLSTAVLLQKVLDDAITYHATDVHLHGSREHLLIRFRVGGTVMDYLQTSESGEPMMRRIKALARMDVIENRLPQDGSFRWVTDRNSCDVRVATLPIVDGEAIVLRLLFANWVSESLTELGMTEKQADGVNKVLLSGTGLLLVAGPTGVGKTTTLYTMMAQLARMGKNVVSIEDPIERPLAECRQMEVRERLGITFEIGLKAILRHDPDAVMIGEIRDEATARVALRAALSGRLVLSTTHAKDVVGAAARLVDFGLSRSLVGDVLSAVVVQHLTRSPIQGRLSELQTNPKGIIDFEVELMSPQLSAMLASEMTWGELRVRLQDKRSNVSPVRRNVQ